MIKVTDHSSIKQYMPMKPISKGVGATIGTSRTFRCTQARWVTLEKGLGAHVVTDLTSELEGKYHHEFLDNLFTGAGLLTLKGMVPMGAEQLGRRGFPPALKKPSLPNRCV